MNYELAKELKDTGFSKSDRWGFITESGTSKVVGYVDEYANHTVPTLSELIEACGDGFRSLTYHSKKTDESTYRRWIAKSGARTGKFLRNGKTPEEAVAKLWLALNKK